MKKTLANWGILLFEIEEFRDSMGERNPWMKAIIPQVQLSIFNGEFWILSFKP